jgi:hypothetical protein
VVLYVERGASAFHGPDEVHKLAAARRILRRFAPAKPTPLTGPVRKQQRESRMDAFSIKPPK